MSHRVEQSTAFGKQPRHRWPRLEPEQIQKTISNYVKFNFSHQSWECHSGNPYSPDTSDEKCQIWHKSTQRHLALLDLKVENKCVIPSIAEMGKNLDSWILILILEIVLDFDFENESKLILILILKRAHDNSWYWFWFWKDLFKFLILNIDLEVFTFTFNFWYWFWHSVFWYWNWFLILKYGMSFLILNIDFETLHYQYWFWFLILKRPCSIYKPIRNSPMQTHAHLDFIDFDFESWFWLVEFSRILILILNYDNFSRIFILILMLTLS